MGWHGAQRSDEEGENRRDRHGKSHFNFDAWDFSECFDDQLELLVDLERAGLKAEHPRLVRQPALAVNGDVFYPQYRQHGREHESG